MQNVRAQQEGALGRQRLGLVGMKASGRREEAAARREPGALGERERERVSLRLLLLDLNDYIVSLFIVLSRLVF